MLTFMAACLPKWRQTNIFKEKMIDRKIASKKTSSRKTVQVMDIYKWLSYDNEKIYMQKKMPLIIRVPGKLSKKNKKRGWRNLI